LAGAVVGVALAQVLSRLLVAFLSTTTDPVFLDLGPDWRVLGFTAGLAIVTCLLFGLTPAIRITRNKLGAMMKAAGRGLTAGRQRFTLRRALLVVQIALSLVLVAGALLFSRSLVKILTVNTGFEDDVLTATVNFRRLNLSQDRLPTFKDELLQRVRAIPGVDSLSSAPRQKQVDAVISALLGGSASADTRAVLMSGENPLLASAKESPDTINQNVDAGDPADMQLRPRANPFGRQNGGQLQLNGIAQVVGLALGSPEFQRR